VDTPRTPFRRCLARTCWHATRSRQVPGRWPGVEEVWREGVGMRHVRARLPGGGPASRRSGENIVGMEHVRARFPAGGPASRRSGGKVLACYTFAPGSLAVVRVEEVWREGVGVQHLRARPAAVARHRRGLARTCWRAARSRRSARRKHAIDEAWRERIGMQHLRARPGRATGPRVLPPAPDPVPRDRPARPATRARPGAARPARASYHSRQTRCRATGPRVSPPAPDPVPRDRPARLATRARPAHPSKPAVRQRLRRPGSRSRHIDPRHTTRSRRGLGRSSRPTFAHGRPSTRTTSAVKSLAPRSSEEPTP
jgi:hypothetical protein